MHPIKPRFRDCQNKNEYRRQMAAYLKALRAHWKAEQEAFEVAVSARMAARAEERKRETVTIKLFGSGKPSPDNPTGKWGTVWQVLTFLIGLPILGLLYKLSFGVLATFLTAIIVLIADKRSRTQSAMAWMLVWSISYAATALNGYTTLAICIFVAPFLVGLGGWLFNL
jgi:hypothetical protein